MGDNPNDTLLETEPEGTPEDVPVINDEVVPESVPEYITKTEFEDILRREIGGLKSSLKQSMTDRDKLIRDEIASRTKRYEEVAAAAGLSQATKAAGIERIKDEVARMHAEADDNPAQDKSPAVPPDPQEVERVLSSIRRFEAKADVFLTPVDKEFAAVARLGNNPAPAEYERVYMQAVQAKAKRLGMNVVAQPGASTAARSASALGGAPAGIPQLEQLNKRLLEIQERDPFFRNRELSAERTRIAKEMEALERTS